MANVLQVIGLNTVTPQLEAGQTSNLDTYSMVSPLTINPSGTAGYSGTNALTVTGNVSVNALYQGTTNQAATTSIQLTASSVTSWIITGSGGQTIILPDATTLPVGAMFTFNNNQSSGAITVNVFGSGSAPATVQSGGYATVTLLTKSVAAGTWDVHYGTPSNVTWSTNTFNYPGTITGATWNGVAVPVLYGGTGTTTATGTAGSVVLSNTPTLVTPVLGAASGTSLALNGATIGSNALAVTGSTLLTPSNGTPAVTLTGGTQTGFALTTVSITGTAGQFSCDATTLTVGQFVTISGTLGGTGTITGYATPKTYLISATNGSTTFTLIVQITGAALVTTAGTPTGLTYAVFAPLLSMTQTWNNTNSTFEGIKLNVTDTASTATSLFLDFQNGNNSVFSIDKTGVANGLSSTNNVVARFGFFALGGSQDVILSRKAAASLQLGNADAAAPVAQTIGPQSVVAGTSNTAGQNLTVRGSQGTGTGVGGDIIFQVAPAGTTGTAQNALAQALRIYNDKTVFAGAGFTVATLPTAGTVGRRAYVTDATAPTFGGTLVGSGSVVIPVFDNGSAWVSA